MKSQFESFTEKILKHQVQFLDAGGPLGLGVHVVQVRADPIRSSADLIGPRAIRNGNQQFQRNAGCEVSLAARRRTDAGRTIGGLAGFDGCDFKLGSVFLGSRRLRADQYANEANRSKSSGRNATHSN